MVVEKYRQIIKQIILEKAELGLSIKEIETQAIIDTERDHYLLLHTGWREKNWIHGCSMHLDIKDGKIWIQHDGTEVGIPTLLLEQGVPANDIVLGFHTPFMRQFTEFAVN